VITVACVLVLSRGLQTSGAIDLLAQRVLPTSAPPVAMLAGLTALTAILSGFMNNVGALALMMPIAHPDRDALGWPPGRMLMPLAFGSILGGMTTLIGTPPNLIVSAFRDDEMGGPFGMFDFAPVGLAVAAAGVAFISLSAGASCRSASAPASRASTPAPTSPRPACRTRQGHRHDAARGRGTARGGQRPGPRPRAQRDPPPHPEPHTRVREGDILVLEAEPEGVASALAALGMKLEEDVAPEEGEAERRRGAEAAGSEAAEQRGRGGAHDGSGRR
jgi:hypothetical protein